MRIGYSGLLTWFSSYSKKAAVLLGFVVLPLGIRLEKVVSAKPIPVSPKPVKPVKVDDPRTLRLKTFLSRLHCPVADLAEDFVHASDDNQLDWRLLPSISVVESGGGKAYRNNNLFGWNNGLQTFTSLREGIQEVAFKLGKSSLYKNRDSVGKLHLYNPDSSYANYVIGVMNRISPVANLKPVSRLIKRQNEFVYAD